MDETSRGIAVVTDLMFRVKVQEAARRAGVDLQFAASREQALALAAEQPAFALFDLNSPGYDAVSLMEEWKRLFRDSKTRLLAYVAHVDVERRRAALAAGCEQVLTRSTLDEKLPNVLRTIMQGRS